MLPGASCVLAAAQAVAHLHRRLLSALLIVCIATTAFCPFVAARYLCRATATDAQVVVLLRCLPHNVIHAVGEGPGGARRLPHVPLGPSKPRRTRQSSACVRLPSLVYQIRWHPP